MTFSLHNSTTGADLEVRRGLLQGRRHGRGRHWRRSTNDLMSGFLERERERGKDLRTLGLP